jgi:protein O-mannosyl-transferase
MQQKIFSWLQKNWGLTALLLATLCIYAPSLSGDFVIDDVIFIKNNPYITDISNVARFFTKGVWENSALEVGTESMYRPMNLVPMMLNHALWGSNPFGYHVFLLLLHLANASLVYVLIRKLASSSMPAAILGAGIFALHPTRVESVAWISGGIDPLVAFFLLSAFLAHIIFISSTQSIKQWRYLVLSLFCFQLALWSKEVAIFFPVMVIAYDWIDRKKIYWPSVFFQTIIVLVYLISRSLVLGSTGKWSDLELTHFSKVLDFGLGYSEMWLFPTHIPFFIQPPEHAVSSAMGIVSAMVMALLLGFFWKVFDTAGRKIISYSIIWTVGFLWPAFLLAFYTNGFYAGRFLYVPALGIAILTAIFYDYLSATYPRFKTALVSAGILLISFYCFVTWKDIPAWHDGGAIYGKVAQDSPQNPVGFIGLGDFYMGVGDYASAEKNYLLAVKHAKKAELKVSSLVNLGMINGMNNKLDQSELYLKEAVKIDPKSSEGWAGLGNLALMKGEYFEAVSFYEKAIAVNSKNYEATMNLAIAYDKTGQPQRGDSLRQHAAAISH